MIHFLKPNTKRTYRMTPYEQVLVAHRGLYDNDKAWPENSPEAFKRAVEHGYEIELDVQLSKDGVPVVFHDDSLKRICGVDKFVWELKFDELEELALAKSDERIPTFAKVLGIIDGKVPLIVEVKGRHKVIEATKKAAKLLDKYEGEYCVESFNPKAVIWYRLHRPDIVRGQLSTDYAKDDKVHGIKYVLLTNLFWNFITYPDFIAYNHKYVNTVGFKICRKIFKAKTVAWTIKSEDDLKRARKNFDVFIFDSFIPREKN